MRSDPFRLTAILRSRPLAALHSRFLAALGVVLAASPVFAGTLYVDASLASGGNNGSTWADAFQGSGGLQAALAASTAGDQIWVADGTYEPTAGSDRTQSFVTKTGVEVYGGFAGGEVTLGQRDPAVNIATLTGDLAGDDGGGNLGENSYHVVRGNGANATALFDGFVVTGGNANGSAATDDDRGGGLLLVSASNPTFTRCRVIGNRCTFGGGAGYIRQSSPKFYECSFLTNVGGSFGGAFDMFDGVAAQFHRCVFAGNTAQRAGGVEIFSGSTTKLYDCLFHGNTSTGSGGGGAIYVASSSAPAIRGCTVVGNVSNVNAAAGLLASGGATTIANSIFYLNTGPGGAQGTLNQISGNTTVSYSCVQGGIGGTGNISADPLLVNPGGGDYHTSASSPCADAGNNAAVPATSTLDLDLTPRFEDAAATADTGSGTIPIVDMGAYELPNILYQTFCFGDGSLPTACPCGNTGSPGHGCLNSDILGEGAVLLAAGAASPDTVTLSATGMLSTSLCIFLQGNVVLTSGAVFGDGVRCVGGAMKRIGTKSASGGAAAYPGAGDPSISARSAALGDPIAPGSMRWYQTWYRDAAPAFCPNPPGNTWNVSSGVAIFW
ncbi:MAG TPA: right-handed parallel beta-helix repeat-containing protein [Planctomycetota bacterium]|jgi:predicted outer membrane repeat protein|nr:right-handed parallel beta-helix repeat-containing protein [Planctomycetota bacterium]